jgi:hypothetical protein
MISLHATFASITITRTIDSFRYLFTPLKHHGDVATNPQHVIPSSNELDKGVAFFLSRSIELAHHARFFRNFFRENDGKMKKTTFEKSCDGSAKLL